MKRMLPIIALLFAAGCARPLYVAGSDAENARMHGPIAQIRETFFDNPAGGEALPDTLGTFDIYTVVTYNRAGNILLTESFKGPDSVQILREEFFYDPSGRRMVRSESHNFAGNSVRVLEYGYDARGNLVSESEITGGYITCFRFDGKGYLKSETGKVSGERKNSVRRYRYDWRGRLKTASGGGPTVKHFYRPDGSLARVQTGKDVTESYGTDGNLEVSTNIVKSGGGWFPVSISARYEYDAHGNWSKRTQFYNGRIVGIAVRETDYYGETEE